MFGKGILKGFRITGGHIFRRKVTEEYPECKPALPDRFKGSFSLDGSKCIACGLCVNSCPNHVIKLDSKKDENNKKVLTGYKMMAERCLFCGFCVEACPTKALNWNKNFERAAYLREDVNLNLFDDYVTENNSTNTEVENTNNNDKNTNTDDKNTNTEDKNTNNVTTE